MCLLEAYWVKSIEMKFYGFISDRVLFFNWNPRWCWCKEPTCQSRRHRTKHSAPGLGRSPGGGHGYFRILTWRIPWTEEPGGLQCIGLQRVRHDWRTQHVCTELIYSVVLVSAVQQSMCVCVCVCVCNINFSHILFYYRLLQDIEYSSLCYTMVV